MRPSLGRDLEARGTWPLKWPCRWGIALGLALVLGAAAPGVEGEATTPTTAAIDASLQPSVQLVVTPHENQIELDWSSRLPHLSEYLVERSGDEAKTWATLAKVDAGVGQYQDAKVIEGVTYLYRVVALDDAGGQLGTSAEASIVAPKSTNLIEAFKGKTIGLKDILDFHFWQSSVNAFVLATLSFIPKLIVAVILFIIFWGIYRMVRRIVVGSMAKAHVDPSIRDMLGTLIKWSIMGFGLVIACNQVGIEIAALLTGVSIIGLAIGFAAQETMANFIAGVVIFWDKPFKVGDWIVIEDMFGQIQRVSFRSTRMLNLMGQTIVMPNTYMLDKRLANHSTHPHVRVDVPIGIAYKESIEHARRALLATTEGDERICKNPPPEVKVEQCADSSVNLTLRVWITDESTERTIFGEYLEKSKNALDAAKIEIPFPHMQLMLENTPALAALAREPLQPAE
jgi:small conductance mechanosensitive channel